MTQRRKKKCKVECEENRKKKIEEAECKNVIAAQKKAECEAKKKAKEIEKAQWKAGK